MNFAKFLRTPFLLNTSGRLLLKWVRIRSSHWRCSVKIGVLKNFPKSTGKCLCQSLLNKVAGLRSATLLKKRLWHRCFLMNFAKFLRTPFVQNTFSTKDCFSQNSSKKSHFMTNWNHSLYVCTWLKFTKRFFLDSDCRNIKFFFSCSQTFVISSSAPCDVKLF